jgi:hypothetical protein
MTSIQNIQAVLSRMVELLCIGGLQDWGGALEKFQDEIATEPGVTISNILSLYGGMGSLNDLILYSNGKPLVSENNELDALRSQLYDLCHA